MRKDSTRHIARLALASILALASASASAQNPDFSFMDEYLKANGISGTVIVENLKGDKTFVCGAEGADRRFLPASTFKIPNTLIALEEGAVKSPTEIIAWDGKDKGSREWNKDQSIMTALPSSCVWFYQELARRVGNEAYLRRLKAMDYGNAKTGKNLATFWLDGDLRISPKEQIVFLKKVYREELPYMRSSYAALKDALIVRRGPGYVVRAKTGWTMRVSPQIGWYVGYAETKDEVWFFAARIDIRSDRDAAFREKAAFKALEGLGLIPKS